MSGSFVRALWGGKEIVTAGKSFNDITLLQQQRSELARFPTVFYAYNQRCAGHLASCGYAAELIEDIPPSFYQIPLLHLGAEDTRSDEYGRWTNGLSMWWRKLTAIWTALKAGNEAVLWLDWDTKVQTTIPDNIFEVLASGPPLQGRIRMYRRPQLGWRRTGQRQVFHGGCIYVRGVETIEGIMRTHAEQVHCSTDEIALSRWCDDNYASEKFFNNTDALVAAGIDNPWLYTTRGNANWQANTDSIFLEGGFLSVPKLQVAHRKYFPD